MEGIGPCPWLVEVRNPLFDCPEWYPDSPEDVNVIVECGAPTVLTEDGEGWRCEAGHEHVPAWVRQG